MERRSYRSRSYYQIQRKGIVRGDERARSAPIERSNDRGDVVCRIVTFGLSVVDRIDYPIKGFIREIGESTEASARQRRTDKHLGAQGARLLDRGANAGEGEAGHDAGEGRNDELNREDDA